MTFVFRSMEVSFPPFKCYFRVDIEGLTLAGRQKGLFSWFGLWNEVFQMGIRHESFFMSRKKIEVVSTGHFMIYNDQTESLCN